MFLPIPMYETKAIQLHFLVRLFWYLLYSGLPWSTLFFVPVYIVKISTVYHYIACWLLADRHGTLAVAGQSGGCKIYKSWTLLVSLPQSILLFQLTIIIPIHTCTTYCIFQNEVDLHLSFFEFCCNFGLWTILFFRKSSEQPSKQYD